MGRLAEVTSLLRSVETVEVESLAGAMVSEVHPRLLLANRVVASNAERLRELGVTHVVNAAHPGAGTAMSLDCSGVAAMVGAAYLGLQLSDTSSQDLRSSFSASGAWVADALEQEGAVVLVNCWAGVSRSAALVIAYLMAHQGMALDQALLQVKTARNIKPNRGFLIQLVRFERELGEKRPGDSGKC